MDKNQGLINQTFLPKASVVVPIYNGEADIPELISCLHAQMYPRDRVEYILVDNASSDRTAELIQAATLNAKPQKLTLYYKSENKIQSSYAARNTGIRASTGEIIAFTDADCRPQPNWLYALLQPFSDSKVGVVGGAVIALPGKSLFEKYAERRNILSNQEAATHPFYPYAAAANLAIRRQTLQEVGMFRPYLTTGGDADICWRIQLQTSWQFDSAEKAIIKHRHRATLWELKKQFRRYGRSHQYLKELYGIEPFENIWSANYYYYRWKHWLFKEMPRALIKIIAGKATLLDLLMTPIDLFALEAQAIGRQEAKLSEKAWEIEWL